MNYKYAPGGLIIYLHKNVHFEPKVKLAICRLWEGQVKLVMQGKTSVQSIHIAIKYRPPSENFESCNEFIDVCGTI